MATIERTLFSIVKTTSYYDVLNNPDLGSMSTRASYGGAFKALGNNLDLPWRIPSPGGRWSQMWSYYLGSPTYLQSPTAKISLTAEKAWEFVVPFELTDSVLINRPDGTRGEVRRLLYPAAVVVIVSVEVLRREGLEDLARSIAEVRGAGDWVVGTAIRNRTIDGIMAQCRDNAAELLVKGAVPEASGETTYTVAGPASGDIEASLLDINRPEIAATVAGLASLSPPGIFEASKLIAANHDAKWPTRAYVTKKGHALWNESLLSGGGTLSKKDTIGCLLRNHTDLAAHIDACLTTVTWAAPLVRPNTVFSRHGCALVGPATLRLNNLSLGERGTYRSEVAKRRIEPFLDDIKKARGGL